MATFLYYPVKGNFISQQQMAVKSTRGYHYVGVVYQKKGKGRSTMKGGLLDFIFQNLEVDNLNRKEVTGYLLYLNEIITTDMAAEDQIKFLACKVKLNNRLVELDKQAAYPKNVG